jgi:uncharacterized protein YjbI with pentapeptide repeats
MSAINEPDARPRKRDTSLDLRGFHLSFSKPENRNLAGADFRGSVLVAVDFREVNLSQARFGRANVQADFRRANLRAADFTSAELAGSDFRGADCRGSDFGGADLTRVKLQGCDLRAADLTRAVGLTRREFARAVTDESTRPPARWRDAAGTGPVVRWAEDFEQRLGLGAELKPARRLG